MGIKIVSHESIQLKQELLRIKAYIQDVIFKEPAQDCDYDPLTNPERFFSERDLDEFKSVLTDREYFSYEKEIRDVEDQRLQVIKKYNKIASDRISKEVLINNIKSKYPVFTDENLDGFDIQHLQLLLNVFVPNPLEKEPVRPIKNEPRSGIISQEDKDKIRKYLDSIKEKEEELI